MHDFKLDARFCILLATTFYKPHHTAQTILITTYLFTSVQCSISECKETSVKTIRVGSQETRRLCRKHYQTYLGKNISHTPVFQRASDMSR